ncbi:MAG TPA: ABC transporter permease, partial [Steroidobacteraceae bacterium]|nr:ABC transporter permease [Steroidobacteraceae bacterium]
MLNHYLITALRHFRQHKVTTGINVACLSLGLLCFVFAYGIHSYLTRSDNYQPNSQRLFVLTEKISIVGTDIAYPSTPSAAWVAADYLKAELPHLQVARASMDSEVAVTAEGHKSFMQVSYADGDLLRLFELPFQRGDGRHALDEPHSAVISAALAQRLFGTQDVIGRSLLINNKESVFVRGVLSHIKKPSHMSLDTSSASLFFEALISKDVHETLRTLGLPPEVAQMRYGQITGHLNYYTYVLLPADASMSEASLNDYLRGFSDRHAGPRVRADIAATPVANIPKLGLDLFTGTDKTGVSSTSLLMLLGALVLLVSCLNYANLEAAQADTRVKETVLRRIVGAGRNQVFIQHFVEALLLSVVALISSLCCLAALAAVSGGTLQAALRLALFDSSTIWILLAGLVLVVSLLTSSYPGVVLSRIAPAQGLRSKRLKSGSKFVAAVLVGAQFVAASFLLITVFVMYSQNAALRNAGGGSGSDPVVMIANDMKGIDVDFDLLRSELSRQPHVQSITASMTPPWSLNGNSFGSVAISAESGSTMRPVVQQYVNYDFFSTLGIKTLAGQVFERDRVSVQGATQEVVVDAELAAQVGATTPVAAIGRTIFLPTSPNGSTPPAPARIVGVVENKPLSLLGLGATATLYQFVPGVAMTTPMIRISRSDVGAGLAEIDAAWERIAPNIALKRRFLDEQFDQNYQIFEWVTNAFAGLALMAFAIGAMGLVGMAIHMASRRLHEIGVRKTLGARPSQIIV